MALILAALALLLAPAVLDRYLMSIAILCLMSAYFGQAWNILMGFCGQLSLGHALYVGLAAYVSAAFYVHLGIGPWLSVIPSVIAGLAAASLLGWLGFRFRIEGVYFALLTIAFAEVARIAFEHLAITGGAGGFFLPVSAQDSGKWWNLRGGPVFFYYLALIMAAAALLAAALLRRGKIGHAWIAVREDPEAARALGINVTRVRYQALFVSAAMTSLGGVFQAFWTNNLLPAQIFDMSRSIDIILAPIIGGIGTLFGPIIGAFLLVPLGEGLIEAMRFVGINAPGAKALVYGFLLMVIIAISPNGVWPWLARKLRLQREEA